MAEPHALIGGGLRSPSMPPAWPLEIDRSHKQAQGLIWAVPTFSPVQGHTQDLVTGIRGVPSVFKPTLAPQTPAYHGMEATSTPAEINFASLGFNFWSRAGSQGVTLVSHAHMQTPVNWSAFLFNRTGTITGLGLNDAGNLILTYNNDEWQDSGPSVPINKRFIAAAAVKPLGKALTIYDDTGATITSDTTDAHSSTGFAFDGIKIGKDSQADIRVFDGWIFDTRVYAGILSTEQIAEIYHHPFAAYKTRGPSIMWSADILIPSVGQELLIGSLGPFG